MKKRIICLALAALMVLSAFTLAGCGEKKANDKYVVGICQLVQHAALDAATQGFMDALNEALPGKVEFQNKNASGEANNCATIVNGFVSDKVDLIMANATPRPSPQRRTSRSSAPPSRHTVWRLTSRTSAARWAAMFPARLTLLTFPHRLR